MLTPTLIMEPSIDGLCQFVQNFIITLDSPIFANRYLVGFVAETQVMNVLRVFGYACEIKCEWRKVVNLVSIYQCYEHFCTIFCFAFLSHLSLYQFVSIYFSCYTFFKQHSSYLFRHKHFNQFSHSMNNSLITLQLSFMTSLKMRKYLISQFHHFLK